MSSLRDWHRHVHAMSQIVTKTHTLKLLSRPLMRSAHENGMLIPSKANEWHRSPKMNFCQTNPISHETWMNDDRNRCAYTDRAVPRRLHARLARKPKKDWRRERDSNPRCSSHGCFQDSCHNPLGHPSEMLADPLIVGSGRLFHWPSTNSPGPAHAVPKAHGHPLELRYPGCAIVRNSEV